MSITNLLARFKAFFSPKPVATPSVTVDESAVIAAIRSQMAHLAHLATLNCSNYLRQWEAYTANIKAQTESVVFMVAATENTSISAEYDSLRCKVLMQFSKFDNLFLDGGSTSSSWNLLREDVIASPSVIGAHALCA